MPEWTTLRVISDLCDVVCAVAFVAIAWIIYNLKTHRRIGFILGETVWDTIAVYLLSAAIYRITDVVVDFDARLAVVQVTASLVMAIFGAITATVLLIRSSIIERDGAEMEKAMCRLEASLQEKELGEVQPHDSDRRQHGSKMGTT